MTKQLIVSAQVTHDEERFNRYGSTAYVLQVYIIKEHSTAYKALLTIIRLQSSMGHTMMYEERKSLQNNILLGFNALAKYTGSFDAEEECPSDWRFTANGGWLEIENISTGKMRRINFAVNGV